MGTLKIALAAAGLFTFFGAVSLPASSFSQTSNAQNLAELETLLQEEYQKIQKQDLRIADLRVRVQTLEAQYEQEQKLLAQQANSQKNKQQANSQKNKKVKYCKEPSDGPVSGDVVNALQWREVAWKRYRKCLKKGGIDFDTGYGLYDSSQADASGPKPLEVQVVEAQNELSGALRYRARLVKDHQLLVAFYEDQKR